MVYIASSKTSLVKMAFFFFFSFFFYCKGILQLPVKNAATARAIQLLLPWFVLRRCCPFDTTIAFAPFKCQHGEKGKYLVCFFFKVILTCGPHDCVKSLHKLLQGYALVHLAAIIEYHRLGSLRTREVIFSCLEAGKSKIKVLAK